jgi:hypothetical protein
MGEVVRMVYVRLQHTTTPVHSCCRTTDAQKILGQPESTLAMFKNVENYTNVRYTQMEVNNNDTNHDGEECRQ